MFCQSLHDPQPVTQPWNRISEIYKVALDVNEPFQGMCQLWADRSGAVRFKSCLTVKKEARAVQKVWRSYKGQPKKLLGKNMVGWFRELFVLVLHAVL